MAMSQYYEGKNFGINFPQVGLIKIIAILLA